VSRLATAAFLAAALATACTGPQVSNSLGLGEPVRIESAQFVAGDLPGLAPPGEDAGEDAGDAGPGPEPQVTDVSIGNTGIAPGSAGVMLSGHTSPTAQAVAIRFAGLGSGFWVVPVGPPDPADNGLLTWQCLADFGRDVPAGFHDLLFAAVDGSGASGLQYDQPLCIDTLVPDNLNVCVPKRKPPAAVLSLEWDTPVDLDLIVQEPSGAFVGGKVRAAPVDGGAVPASTATATDGVLDHDSNAACVIDDLDREDIVWQSPPAPGTYAVWVDLFSACKQPGAAFTVSLWRAGPRPDAGAEQQLLEQQPLVATGEINAGLANGGAGHGLYVGAFVLR
jgi:hypothetical protein